MTPALRIGSGESHFNFPLIVRDKVTRHYPQSTTFEEKGEPPKRNRAERLFIVLSHLQRHYAGKLVNHIAVRLCEGPFSLLPTTTSVSVAGSATERSKLANTSLSMRVPNRFFSLLQLRQCRWWGQRPRGRNQLSLRCQEVWGAI